MMADPNARKESWINAGALVLALGLASAGPLWAGKKPAVKLAPSDRQDREVYPAQVTDARQHEVKTGAYRRMVSLDPEASRLILSIVSPARLLAVSSYAKTRHPWGFRFGDIKTIDKSTQIDDILALSPDLVFVSPLSDAATVARLRDVGIAVYDLGGTAGIDASLAHLDRLGTLLHQRPRASQAKAALAQRLAGLKARLGDRTPIPGIYLTRYADKFYGGTTGTSYADLLKLAGVEDLAAKQGYRNWPSYTIEALWALDPQVIVTAAGQAAAICADPKLGKLKACTPAGQVIEALPGLESDSGAGLLTCAGELLERLHPTKVGP